MCGEAMSLVLYMYSMDLRVSSIGAEWYCCCFLFRRLLRRKKASEIRAMRMTAPATAPPISAPRCFDDDDDEDAGGGEEVGEAVCMIMFVVVIRLPLAEVTTETMEITLTRFVGGGDAVAPSAFLVIEVDVDADVDVDVDVDVEVGVVEVDEDDDDVEVVSLDVVSPLPGKFPMMSAEGTAGPVVLIEATEIPLDNGKKSLEFVLSQQTLDTFRLWSQHQSPP